MFALMIGMLVLVPSGQAVTPAGGADEQPAAKCVQVITTDDAGDANAAVYTATAHVVTTIGDDQQIRVLYSDVDGPDGVRVFAVGDDDMPGEATIQKVVVMGAPGDGDLPGVWIGVRITAVPAPLAAHIGDRGVMISNVVEDSPADEAGLAQYDVVVAYNGYEVNEPADLTAAIGDTQPGDLATLTIVRQAAERDIQIRPAERPEDPALSLKYTEPQDTFLNSSMQLRGRALRLGPDGQWIMEDLGELGGMPDVLKRLENLHGTLDFSGLEGMGTYFDVDVNSFPDAVGDNAFAWISKQPGEADAHVEIRVKVNDDGQSTTLQMDADGKIHVTRSDADGNETTETYDSAEALQAADPEVYEDLIERHGLEDALDHRIMIVRPHGCDALKLRKQFQVDVHKRIEDALKDFHDGKLKIYGKCGEAFEEAEKAFLKSHTVTESDGATHEVSRVFTRIVDSSVLTVAVDDDGSVKVIIADDDGKQTLDFDNVEAFAEARPDLYASVESYLEDAD